MEVSVNNEIRERENMRYKANFFDWDGTAVESREAPADKVTGLMRQLLASGVVMVIISGTTYDKIADGKLERYFTEKELANLYLGLGRGACNYSFKNGEPVLQEDSILGLEDKLKIHKGVFRIHQYLLEKYSLNSDIVFTRPNYCKLDLMAEHCRNGRLYLQDGEVGDAEGASEGTWYSWRVKMRLWRLQKKQVISGTCAYRSRQTQNIWKLVPRQRVIT